MPGNFRKKLDEDESYEGGRCSQYRTAIFFISQSTLVCRKSYLKTSKALARI